MRGTRMLTLVVVALVAVVAAVTRGSGEGGEGEERVCAANSPEALGGLTGVRGRVQLDGAADEASLSAGALEPMVELELRKAGIDVLSEEEAKARYPQGAPMVFVYVAVMDAGPAAGDTRSFFYSTNVQVWEDVTLRRNTQQVVIGAATWRRMVTGRTTSSDPAGEIYHTVLDLLDALGADNATANPKS